MRSRLTVILPAILMLLASGSVAKAHPLLENALDVLIGKSRIVVEARISREQILLVEAGGAQQVPPQRWAEMTRKHAGYVRDHLRIRVDDRIITVASTALMESDPAAATASSLIPYRIEYALITPPAGVKIDQSFLRELPTWSASCVIRIRQENQSDWETALLTPANTAEYGCDWTATSERSATTVTQSVNLGPTIRAYVGHGIMHILTGYDHMLFVTALILATTRLWDLVKVVTAFTIAHTITLALSVFNLVTLSEHVVEPMIALSIIFIAVQNIFWPERSRGWVRLVIAFSFGLFHGLGFAGGLKEAMTGMPHLALWAALISFSLGVEIAHQLVVIPLYSALHASRNWNAPAPRLVLAARTRQVGSAFISLAGVYFLFQAIRL